MILFIFKLELSSSAAAVGYLDDEDIMHVRDVCTPRLPNEAHLHVDVALVTSRQRVNPRRARSKVLTSLNRV